MSRAHSYAQIPVSEAQQEPSTSHITSANNSSILSNIPLLTSSNGYSRIENEDENEFEEGESSMPHQPTDSEITISPSIQSSASSSSSTLGASSTAAAEARLPSSRPQFPAAAGARRMIQQTMDGVFSNLSAKPRVEKPTQEELPPPYKSAAMDQSPAYYETTVMATGYSEDDVLVDGLPVGGLFGFVWNMIFSMSFQFIGFFLTYLLHTSHATKNGSKMGLGITFISMGMQMMTGKTEMDEPADDSDTGYMGNAGEDLKSVKEYLWLAYFMVFLGTAIMLQSGLEFARAKRTEMIAKTTSSGQISEFEMTSESAV
ncbi:hypothetical protein BGZ58_009355 [Dissophora ornata]|nr:hypothetical protein BGZ58_009355 [Dissophora ornata]